MAWLVPQSKCPSSADAHFRPSLPSFHSGTRNSVFFQTRCVLSPPAIVSNIERIPTLESRSSSIDAIGHWTSVGSVGPLTKTNDEATTTTEMLGTSEDAVIAAAAAEAVALARAAVEVARGAANMIGNVSSSKTDKSENFPSESDIMRIERIRLAEREQDQMINHPDAIGTKSYEFNIFEDISTGADASNSTQSEFENGRIHNNKRIMVSSGRQTERRARRARALGKIATGAIPVKSGTSSKKKRSAFQEIDHSDPLRYLRMTTSTSKLLTASEEQELSEGIQDLLKLERLQKELAERNGSQPTLAQWAAAAGVDQKTLRIRLNYGSFCKDKMIKSNIRLVISIAKNYQGVGMNLQDLVQEGCRGLLRGAEKFDASKGFKFSTYAHWWIKQSVRRSLSEQSRTIRLPFHMVEAAYRVKEARKQLYSENGRHPDHKEVAEATGLTMKRLAAVMMAPKAPRSLDQKIGINETLKPSEVIADPDAETSEDMLMKQFMKNDLHKLLDMLNPREKQVVRWRFGLEDGRMKTLQEIGELMGVSRERIRQIESSAFRKLRNKKRTKNLSEKLRRCQLFVFSVELVPVHISHLEKEKKPFCWGLAACRSETRRRAPLRAKSLASYVR